MSVSQKQANYRNSRAEVFCKKGVLKDETRVQNNSLSTQSLGNKKEYFSKDGATEKKNLVSVSQKQAP